MIPPFAQIVRTLIPSFLLAQLCFHSIASADVEKGRTAANRGDFETALSEWRASAQQGDSEAKYLLGRLYANGDGVQRDFQAAFQWFLAAAKAGHRGAQQALAKMYERGDGVQKDRTKAALWRSGKGSGEDEASEAPPVKKVSLTSMNGRVAKNDTRLAEPTVAGGVSLGSSDDFTKVPESATQREGLSPPVGSETKRDQPKASASTGGGEPSLGSHSDIIAAGGASPTAASLPTLSRWNGVCPTSTSSQAEKEDFEQAVAELFHLITETTKVTYEAAQSRVCSAIYERPMAYLNSRRADFARTHAAMECLGKSGGSSALAEKAMRAKEEMVSQQEQLGPEIERIRNEINCPPVSPREQEASVALLVEAGVIPAQVGSDIRLQSENPAVAQEKKKAKEHAILRVLEIWNEVARAGYDIAIEQENCLAIGEAMSKALEAKRNELTALGSAIKPTITSKPTADFQTRMDASIAKLRLTALSLKKLREQLTCETDTTFLRTLDDIRAASHLEGMGLDYWLIVAS